MKIYDETRDNVKQGDLDIVMYMLTYVMLCYVVRLLFIRSNRMNSCIRDPVESFEFFVLGHILRNPSHIPMGAGQQLDFTLGASFHGHGQPNFAGQVFPYMVGFLPTRFRRRSSSKNIDTRSAIHHVYLHSDGAMAHSR